MILTTLPSLIFIFIATFAIKHIAIYINQLYHDLVPSAKKKKSTKGKKERIRIEFGGLHKQCAQGQHGWKGTAIGKKHGYKSLTSPLYQRYNKALKLGQVANHGRPSKSNPKAPSKKSMCAGMNMKQRMDFIDTVEQMIKESGTPDHIQWVKAGRRTWGRCEFDTAYPDKVTRKVYKNIVKKWWERRRSIKCLYLAGFGHLTNFLPGKQPTNPYENQIKLQCKKMAACRMKMGPMLLTHVAAVVSKGNGMRVRINNGNDNSIKRMIYESMFSDINDICKQSEIDNPKGPIFNITPKWRQKFRQRMNIKYGAEQETECDLFGLLTNLEPSLEFCWTMRKIFNIEGGTGNILNCDQTMYYRLYQPQYVYNM